LTHSGHGGLGGGASSIWTGCFPAGIVCKEYPAASGEAAYDHYTI
jgi:hypothetical protein